MLVFFTRLGLAGSADFPLKDVAVKNSIDLSGDWGFKIDDDDAGTTNGWFKKDFNRSGWKPVAVPGVWDKKPGEIDFPISSCIGWFHRQVTIPKDWQEDIAITFLGSMYSTDLWMDGQYVGVHLGGYTPFTFDLAKFAKPDSKIDIVVRVDNRLTPTMIPSSQHIGWQYFGGLYRQVYLVHKPMARPENIETAIEIPDDNTAKLKLNALFKNGTSAEFPGSMKVELFAQNIVVASSNVPVACSAGKTAITQTELTVKNPTLWCPDNPFLYNLVLSWGVDRMEFPVGLREFRVQDGKFLLNNKRIWMQGFGQHEEYFSDGPCYSYDKRLAELKLMKDVYKINAIRPGHYPNHPDLYNICDKLGILVFTEIPAWQVNREYLESNEAWELWLEPQLREMVQTLRNHASVFGWGISNEIGGTHGYFKHALEYLRKMDATRQASLVLAATEDFGSIEFLGLIARNFHYGWYHSKLVYALRKGLADNERAANGKPIWVAELGAHAKLGNLKGGYGDESRGSEEYQDKAVRFGYQYCATSSELITGISIWTWSDFHQHNDILPHGILNEKREPKIVAYTVCNLFRGDLRLFVCEKNARCRPGKEWSASLRYLNILQQEKKNLKAVWKILSGIKTVDSGEIKFDVTGVRSAEISNIAWKVPDENKPARYYFWIELFDSEGKWLYTNSSVIDVVAETETRGRVSEPQFPGLLKVKVLDDGIPLDDAWVLFEGIRMPVYSFPGLIIPLDAGTYPIEIKAEGRQPRKREITVKPAESTEVIIDFSKKDEIPR
ncbi:MAG: hypothetical protein A2X45_15875 [Lentisphaerae bacterium GWF2_50_93]|nr:MAG: hypothetical protein A2X45_15875 [Lentisphaerae bacterium GWF2_50_93]